MIIKLENAYNLGCKVRINVEHITAYEERNGFLVIDTVSSSFTVRHTAAQLDQVMNECYEMVKDIPFQDPS